MKLIINGQPATVTEALRLPELLALKGLNPERLAVELNGEIVPKSRYHEVILKEQDTLELLSFVGGG